MRVRNSNVKFAAKKFQNFQLFPIKRTYYNEKNT